MSAKIPFVHESSARPDAAYAPTVDSPTKPCEAGGSSREWRPAPGGLVSLWDMLRIHAETFLLLMKAFARLEPNAEALIQRLNQTSLDGSPPQKTEEARQVLSLFLETVERNCQELELTSGLDQVLRLRKMFKGKLVPEAFRAGVKELENRIEDELKRRTFFFIPFKRVRFLEQEHPFGEEVRDEFPELTGDIDEASKCIGNGRMTAAVFHLMRVMEEGVKRVAKVLKTKVSLEQPWGAILKGINDAIAELPARSPKTKTQKERFHEIAAYLHHVKDAWRNSTMHPKRTYTEEEAEHLFNNVRIFMQSLVKLR